MRIYNAALVRFMFETAARITDIVCEKRDVRFVPDADIGGCRSELPLRALSDLPNDRVDGSF